MQLDEAERQLLDGHAGPTLSRAMRIVVAAGRVEGAPRLIPISSAHVDGCLYHGPSSLDFVRSLLGDGARVRVPTTLNVGGLDLLSPDIFRGPAEQAASARELMADYVALGAQPTFTCAPYQLPGRPQFGEDVAWAESNAIVFGNSVIGLRTNRYGDLIDICAALTVLVPYSGLHVPDNRAARVVFTFDAAAVDQVDDDLLPSLLGHHIGRLTGTDLPAIVGPDGWSPDEDWLKNLGAAAASSGAVAMFHLVGVTPEAPDLDSATRGTTPLRRHRVGVADLQRAHDELTTATDGQALGGVSVGTPHLSRRQLRRLGRLLDGRRVAVPTYATTSRSVLAAEPEAELALRDSGVTIVRDTCTYGQSVIMTPAGAVMTNSAKWAYYAPAHLGFSVRLASMHDCVESAVAGQIRESRRA